MSLQGRRGPLPFKYWNGDTKRVSNFLKLIQCDSLSGLHRMSLSSITSPLVWHLSPQTHGNGVEWPWSKTFRIHTAQKGHKAIQTEEGHPSRTRRKWVLVCVPSAANNCTMFGVHQPLTRLLKLKTHNWLCLYGTNWCWEPFLGWGGVSPSQNN